MSVNLAPGSLHDFYQAMYPESGPLSECCGAELTSHFPCDTPTQCSQCRSCTNCGESGANSEAEVIREHEERTKHQPFRPARITRPRGISR